MKKLKNYNTWQSVLKYSASVLLWILIWLLIALKLDSELLLPSPGSVFKRLCELLMEKDFYIIALTSLARIIVGITVGIGAGIFFAVLTTALPPFEAILRPIFSIIKATPVASFIMLALLWINNSLLPSFITLLIVFPVAWANTSEGIRNTPKDLLEISSVYKIGITGKLLHVYLPSLLPFFVSTAKSALGLAWKAGIAAEVLAVPQTAIGSKIYSSKVFLETTDLFVWTLVTIILSIIMESVANALLSRLESIYSIKSREAGNGN
jgi:NitT/TauT family transport system permease protein